MAAPILTTPRADGFAMPPEWAAQDGCWMVWPERPDNWRLQAAPAQAAFATVANTIAEYEPVTMCVSAAQAAHARAQLVAAVRIVVIPTNDAWMRDIGPTFVQNPAGALRAVDWIFNAWGGHHGGLYCPWDDDDRAASKIAALVGVDCYRAPFVLEGGAIHVDGEGTCLTTEQCLLNPNRNPDLTRGQIEAGLRAYLGVERIVWLGEGVYLDETDGHVDNLCCFLRPGVVALTWCEDPADPQHAISKDALARLARSTDARGRPFEVIKLPGPATPLTITGIESAGVTPREGVQARVAGARLAASYVNFLIVNNAVIVPAFSDPADAVAREILAAQFPARQIRQVPGREILLGGGNIHCITQQQPRGPHAP
jgi:agmatine deiminase